MYGADNAIKPHMFHLSTFHYKLHISENIIQFAC